MAFRRQLELAVQFGKPLVLHVVRAHEEVIQSLQSQSFQGLTGLVHSFSGSVENARKYTEMGWLLSFSARITHPSTLDLQQVLLECPPECLVFETDAPDQPPFGHPKSIHTPVSLFKVVERGAAIRKEAVELLLDRSRENLSRVFRLNLPN